MRANIVWAFVVFGCAGGNRGTDSPDMLGGAGPMDLAVGGPIYDLARPHDDDGPLSMTMVVINEVDPNGPSPMTNPDWVELKNVGAAAADVSGFEVRDSKQSDLTALPDGTVIAPGGYLLILCDDAPDGGAPTSIHVPFKLSGGSGDEFHLVTPAGTEMDVTSWGANMVPNGMTWSRIPDGTGPFQVAAPTRGAANMP